jgi:hypothetical protein
MLNLKKTAVAVLAFGSSAVFAGTMGPVCTPGNVTVPCERSAWDFAGQALYLDPAFGGNDFIGATNNGTNTSYINNNKWSWGFKLEGSYHFNTGNDIDLNWYHWNRSSTRTPGTGYVDFMGNTYSPGVSGTSKPHWDAVNLEVGQHVDFSQMSSARFHVGVEYARIASSLNVTSLGTLPAGSTTATQVISAATSSVTYNGFGPRGGVDLDYNFGNGLSVYGNTAGTLLAGSNKFNGSFTTQNGTSYTSGGSTTTVVPELEAKLGAMYTYAMAQGDLSLDIGWMWVNYFNVQEFGGPIFAANSTTLPSGSMFSEANFSVQGPYIGLKWVGNIA